MKICHINTLSSGGAAKAAYRLNNELNFLNFDSFILSRDYQARDSYISPYNQFTKYIASIYPYLDNLLLKLFFYNHVDKWSTNWFKTGLLNELNKKNFDIAHFHWIGNGFIGLGDILNSKVPMVWTLHDSWAFTGGCHIPYNCEKFKNECGKCPQLNSKRKYDLSYFLHLMKKRAYKQDNLTFVCPSEWLHSCALNSSLLKNKNIITIPNGIDLNIFKPLKKEICRELFKLPQNKIILMFAAVNSLGDKLKGFHLLQQALQSLEKYNDSIELLVIGSEKTKLNNLNFKVHYSGFINDDITMSIAYSASDTVIVPSISENLPFIVMEALACEIPVVAFNIGGIPEMIKHKVNGWLAEPFSVESLKNGIEWCVNQNLRIISKNNYENILSKYDIKNVTQKYINIYKKSLHA